MENRNEHAIVAISIACEPARLARFVKDPQNLPRWANAFCKSVRKEAGEWRIETDMGELTISFVNATDDGILDHRITLPDRTQIQVPMRVKATSAGCEVSLTINRLPEMTDQDFERDQQMVRSDLERLRAVLET